MQVCICQTGVAVLPQFAQITIPFDLCGISLWLFLVILHVSGAILYLCKPVLSLNRPLKPLAEAELTAGLLDLTTFVFLRCF